LIPKLNKLRGSQIQAMRFWRIADIFFCIFCTFTSKPLFNFDRFFTTSMPCHFRLFVYFFTTVFCLRKTSDKIFTSSSSTIKWFLKSLHFYFISWCLLNSKNFMQEWESCDVIAFFMKKSRDSSYKVKQIQPHIHGR
jgi:hypothetical protein